ncbi:YgiW/YdeI family stress tolerance OB fold protein [Spirabiliibacterium falconis]|uniref:YgiW/YdeI family stress tolerance OB fold protein n=1 Tax=Spirabiliibacterium falconis TaxID=572023 RepID=UPI001AAD7775|nr:NirD/YgiW/YdeI family stress tolerance protein [Spirabiliibacterium falconis]MBE2894969.1 NirD/YgiW/YdeI family stress tolerance protein [Spirabiliibacterium falconis]
MKKVLLASMMLSMFTANAVWAASETNLPEPQAQPYPKVAKAHKHERKHDPKHKEARGGFVATDQVTPSDKISTLNDHSMVVLEGGIIAQTGRDEFTFKDDAGEASVKIDKRAWAGQTVQPTDKVKLVGKVDKSWGKTTLYIHHVMKQTSTN